MRIKKRPFNVNLTSEQWQNIPDTKDSFQTRAEISNISKNIFREKIMPVITEIVINKLTPRQRAIIVLYFQNDYTQVQISNLLGISQPTVNQHLMGKKRNGKRIGGAIIKIRKCINKVITTQLSSNDNKSNIDLSGMIIQTMSSNKIIHILNNF